MIASAKGISYLKRDRQYTIPYFQRNYVWSEENWEEFYDSLLYSLEFKKSAFLGSIIIKNTGKTKWDKSIFNVIDGQQRLTTISLFIKAFLDQHISINDRNYFDIMNTLFIYKNKSSLEKDTKIKHSLLDRIEFEKCINSFYKDNYNEVENNSRIFLCYKYFREKLDILDSKFIDEIKELILNEEKELYKIFVLIEIDSEENEQKIFDTVNSSGVKLTSADIIKNFIFDRLMELSTNEEDVIDFYNKTWYKHFIKDEENFNYWEQDSISGRISRERIEVFLHSVSVIKGIYNPSKNKIEELPIEIKKHIINLSENELKGFIEEICKYSVIYKEKFTDFEIGHLFSLNERIDVILKNIDLFETSAFNPYILKQFYLNKYEGLSYEVLENSLIKLEKLIVRTLICGTGGNKNFNKINSDLIQEDSLKILDTLLNDDRISDNYFRKSMTFIKDNKFGRALLYNIMLHRIKKEDNKGSRDSLQYVYSLEHIMPRSFQTNWSIDQLPLLRYDEEGLLLSIEELNEYRKKSIQQLGNLTLIKQKLNSQISNNDFNTKINGVGNKKGIRDFEQLSICSEILNLDIWNEDEIEKRSKKLIDEVILFW